MDKILIENLQGFEADAHKALRFALSLEIRSRGEEVTEAAIAAEALRLDPKALVVDGTLYRTVAEASRAYNLNPSGAIICNHMSRRNETLEQAIRTAMRRIIVNGISYLNIADAARAHGVSRSPVCARMKRKNETAEQAINAVRNFVRGVPVTVYNVNYSSLLAAVKANGISHSAVWAHMKNGKTAEQAIEIVRNKDMIERRGGARNFTNAAPVTVYGIVYPSVKAAVRVHSGIGETSVHRRMKNGKTAEQAIDALLAKKRAR